MSASKESSAERRWRERYVDIKKRQIAAPIEEKWRFGPLLKEAMANFFVERELRLLGIAVR